MTDHDFLPPDSRCCHCGTLASHHEKIAQPCPGRPRGEALRPAPERHQLAADDYSTIGRRLAELAAERAAMNEAR